MPEWVVFCWLLARFVGSVVTLVIFVLLMTGYLELRRKRPVAPRQTRWCGRCHDHPAHRWWPYPADDLPMLCLGGWDGRKVKI